MVDQIDGRADHHGSGVLIDVLPEHAHRKNRSGAVLYPVAKRVIDIVGAVVLLILFLPVLIAVAWWIRRDGGSVIFRHNRVGHHGKQFSCLKLRTMVIDAQQRLDALLERDAKARAEWRHCQKLSNDPRITRFGRFLRVTSFDELPQLVNVLRGEMSLVGPRPITRDELERYGNSAAAYLSCKPGLTGLWQVSGRSTVDYRRRIQLDAEYARTMSLWLDLVIMIKTVRVIVARDGAC